MGDIRATVDQVVKLRDAWATIKVDKDGKRSLEIERTDDSGSNTLIIDSADLSMLMTHLLYWEEGSKPTDVQDGLGFYYVVGAGSDTLTYAEVCLSGTTAGGKATTPVRISDKGTANEIAAKLGGHWLVETTPWPSHPHVGPAVFYNH